MFSGQDFKVKENFFFKRIQPSEKISFDVEKIQYLGFKYEKNSTNKFRLQFFQFNQTFGELNSIKCHTFGIRTHKMDIKIRNEISSIKDKRTRLHLVHCHVIVNGMNQIYHKISRSPLNFAKNVLFEMIRIIIKYH